MIDGRFSLGGYEWGIGLPVVTETFDTGSAAVQTQDSSRPLEDGVNPGRDTLEGPTWTFEMYTAVRTQAEALAALGDAAAAWRPPSVRTPRAVLPLRYAVQGRTRMVYGRPRRWAAPVDNQSLSGLVNITADFQCADPLHYEGRVEQVSVSLVPTSQGGVVLPATLPWTFGGSGVRSEVVQVTGSAPSHLRVRIHGPVASPVVRIGDVEFGWRGVIAEGDWIEGSGWPWSVAGQWEALSATTNTGASAAGNLTRRTRLGGLRLKPGLHRVEFTGSDVTNLARAEVFWQNAHHSL